jgi:hypothetical protein
MPFGPARARKPPSRLEAPRAADRTDLERRILMKTRSLIGVAGASAALTAAAAVGAYLRIVRPRVARWGAEDEEVARAMPLDGSITDPDYVTNRAIKIEASPDEIWLWIAQMGESPRGGYYSYEWIERRMGMDIKNARTPIPGCPAPQVGDKLDRRGHMLVKAVEPRSYIVVGPPADDSLWVQATWCLALYPIDESSTRLISRVRARTRRRSASALVWKLLLDPGQFAMERKMLLEIKALSEELARERRRLRETFEAVQLEAMKAC